MAVKIRLRQQGKKNRQTYRLVLIDGRSKRDGKYLENLGWYNPFENQNNLSVNAERVAYWLDKGAEISHQAMTLVAKSAPEVVKNYHEKRMATRTKRAAQRREAKKA
ncbi:MAG: 30S ribosomal protein S16 [Chlamydiales bacterium]|nr:30S ribosomal protein S16 [Chlamydiales bacterium]